MKKFIVVSQEWDRFGGEPIEVEIKEAKSLEDLCKGLIVSEGDDEKEVLGDCETFEELITEHEDNMYIIHEMLEGDKLKKVLPLED